MSGGKGAPQVYNIHDSPDIDSFTIFNLYNGAPGIYKVNVDPADPTSTFSGIQYVEIPGLEYAAWFQFFGKIWKLASFASGTDTKDFSDPLSAFGGPYIQQDYLNRTIPTILLTSGIANSAQFDSDPGNIIIFGSKVLMKMNYFEIFGVAGVGTVFVGFDPNLGPACGTCSIGSGTFAPPLYSNDPTGSYNATLTVDTPW